MTELQIGLIGLGAAAVVGVYGYNKWQEYRHRKLADKVLTSHHEDALLSGKTSPRPTPVRAEPEQRPHQPQASAPVERVEPVFNDPEPTLVPPDFDVDMPELEPMEFIFPEIDPPAENERPVPVADNGRLEPTLDSPTPSAARETDLPPELLDPRLEFVVAMELVEPVSVGQILRSQHDAMRRLNKPVHWIGFNEHNREWEPLQQDSSFPVRRLRVGLQLVNRLGPVADGDVAIFTNAMQGLADELTAVADMPSSRILDQAAELDRFCAAVDLEIGINLISRGAPFAGTKIRALAEAAGLELGVDGVFTRYDEAGHAQFCLQNYESTQFSADSVRMMTTHGLTFLIDVPRVDHGERVFTQMTDLAKRFAETLQGILVDDNRQPLTDTQLEHIRREFIGKPQATMASFGLAAGSPQALRLFS